MENAIYIGLSRQMTLRTNMDIIANNVANINTPGFRGQNLLFHEFITKPKGEDNRMSFVYDDGQYEATESGPVKVTGNPLDVALNGPGFIAVDAPDGAPAYTRAGNFQIGPNSTLVTGAGHPVAGGITIPSDSTEIKIDAKGVISNQNGQIGQLKIVEFENIQSLKAMGSNLYRTDAAEKPAEETTVKQGALEASNVKPIVEMTRMIDTLRSFQSVQNILQSENERLRGAIRQLTSQG